ncbi:unnamed protein product [Didymodactylos carnosus]|uniref:Protein kinase domain-containing protein n=1 Tax=Didymodactylos carnosus TaxID=1234261 RepID=A0A815IGK9_9BILA|nr:unnamed protein product [Didymodactylos carnosus]CAF4252730.1 unnamed protein product [Didymodactylos carnosus]
MSTYYDIPTDSLQTVTLPYDVPSNTWKITEKATSEQVLIIHSQKRSKTFCCIKTLHRRKNNNLKQMNCYRELIALKTLTGTENIVRLIDSNIADDKEKGKKFWIIMECAPGCTLKEFINKTCRGRITFLEAILITQQLVSVVKNRHSKGILHRNILLENIMIEWDYQHSPIDTIKITLINFSYSYTKEIDVSTTTHQSSKTNRYNSPTIDTINVCSILLWLLTNVELPITKEKNQEHAAALAVYYHINAKMRLIKLTEKLIR